MAKYVYNMDSNLLNTLDYDNINYLSANSTGTHEHEYIQVRTYTLGKYEVTVLLSPKNEFLGISEIRLNKDFVSYKDRTTPSGFHDVEEFYRE